MASHDTDLRKLRAASQENTARIQKLNEELSKLKGRIARRDSDASETKSQPGTRKRKV
jgi:TolA-binding protein